MIGTQILGVFITEFFLMKDKYSITKRWEKKISDMKIRTDLKYQILLKKKKEKVEANWEWEIQKLEKKKNTEIKKKEERMRRSLLNEIRIFEWKPKREYKTDAPKIKPLQFAMSLAQENSKLRDTDKDGNGNCISCDKYCERWELAWWHRYSRMFKKICLEKENINAQCHTCNRTTWPRWDSVAKIRTNEQYDVNLDKKYWEWTAAGLKQKLYESTHWNRESYDLEMLIPELIEENEKLWATKNFYKPWKKRRAVWTKYRNRT